MRLVLVIALLPVLTSTVVAAEGNPRRGQQLFQGACAACHSLKPNTNMTGPSLAGVWHRKAAGLASFSRYSPAMKNAKLIWDDNTLSAWIENPAVLIPGNRMTFPGIKDAQARTDLLSFLKEKTAPGQAAEAEQGGGMGGMMGGMAAPNLRQLTPDQQVTAITWVCTRNDVLGNIAVLLAALGVFGTGTGWPDVIVAAIMAALALQGAVVVVRQAGSELQISRTSVPAE